MKKKKKIEYGWRIKEWMMVGGVIGENVLGFYRFFVSCMDFVLAMRSYFVVLRFEGFRRKEFRFRV